MFITQYQYASALLAVLLAGFALGSFVTKTILIDPRPIENAQLGSCRIKEKNKSNEFKPKVRF